ncbi:MAG: beta-L-arabinofuranosidase domain-containing protein [Candidatus Latescibacterota bacterium]
MTASATAEEQRPLGHRPARKRGYQARERLIALAPGCVRPSGWVKRSAELECDGFMVMIVQEDHRHFLRSFYEGSPTVFSGEHAGYWNDAAVGLALISGREDSWAGICERIEATLSAAAGRKGFVSEHYNGWGVHLMIMALMTYFEATGDQRVLALCHRIALEMATELHSPEGTAFLGDHPVNMASSCALLFGYTGDERMLAMAETIAARFDAGGLPNLHRLLHDDLLAGHCVNYCEDLRYPADLFLASGNPDHLAASRRGVALTERDHLQIHGAPSGNEMVYGLGPHKETEHCDTVEWSFVGHALLAATGESAYADLAESALFNAWAGSRKWDGRSLSYTFTPNQLTAAGWDSDWPPRKRFSAFHWPQCCNLNSHRALAPYASRMCGCWLLRAGWLRCTTAHARCAWTCPARARWSLSSAPNIPLTSISTSPSSRPAERDFPSGCASRAGAPPLRLQSMGSRRKPPALPAPFACWIARGNPGIP